MRRLLLIPLLVAGLTVGSPSHASSTAGPARIVYSTDWGGPSQLYAVDPAGRAALAQVTVGREPTDCRYAPVACGYVQPVASPDGRWIVYRSAGARGREDLSGAAWVSRANGSGPRRLRGALPGWGTEWLTWARANVAWSHDGRRLAYSASDGLHVVELPGFRERLVTAGSTRFPTWSPDGRALAYRTSTTVVVWRAGRTRVVGSGALGGPDFPYADIQSRLGWSPDGRRLAYRADGRILVAAAAGASAGRVLGQGSWATWSASGDRLAYEGPRGTMLARGEEGKPVLLTRSAGSELAWSPDGSLLALVTTRGVVSIDATDGHTTLLASGGAHDLAWAPDGRSLAYLVPVSDSPSVNDLRIVSLSGRVRTVVSAAGRYGGRITSFAWLQTASGLRFSAPQPVDGLYAGGPVAALAADGDRVVAVTCGRVVLSIAGGAPRRLDDRGPVDCQTSGDRSNIVQALAVSRAGVVYSVNDLGLSYTWRTVHAAPDPPFTLTRVDGGQASLGGPMGTAAGSGSLLVFSSQPLPYCPGDPSCTEVWQELRRVDAGGVVTRIARAEIGRFPDAPIQPLDVDEGRVLTIRAGADLSIWDAQGRKLLLLFVRPRSLNRWYVTPADGAALSGDDLVVSGDDGTLRVYDATTGALRRSIPNAGVVQDAARGLAATVLDGTVHLVRLADGADASVGPGTIARFDDLGLVYVDGARIRLVSVDKLPLR